MMKTKIAALLVALLGFIGAASAQTTGVLQLHGELDMSTNAPNISIRHLDNTVTNRNDKWLEMVTVQNGDVFTVNYPCADDQLHNATWGPQDPVILAGTYTTYAGDGTTVVTQDNVWIRLPRGNSGAAYQFFVDTYTPYSLRFKMIQLFPACQPVNDARVTPKKPATSLFATITKFVSHLWL